MKNLLYFSVLFSILISSCEMADENEQVTEFEESVALMAYFDLSFSMDDSARLFSTKTGESYAIENIDEGNGALIDLVSVTNQSIIRFNSPDDQQDEYDVPNATYTAIQHTNTQITTEEFDAMVNGNLLADIAVEADDAVIDVDDLNDRIILFKNASGEKGAIKLKMINDDRLVVDIKITQ